jgi:hypothetical protein
MITDSLNKQVQASFQRAESRIEVSACCKEDALVYIPLEKLLEAADVIEMVLGNLS